MARKMKARPPRKKTGEMNKTEAAYYNEVITPKITSGEFLSYRFEEVKIRLADNTWFIPDFEIITKDFEVEYHEVKACMASGKMLIEDDANVKIKVAADKFQERKFILCGKLPKKMGGGWVFKEIGE